MMAVKMTQLDEQKELAARRRLDAENLKIRLGLGFALQAVQYRKYYLFIFFVVVVRIIVLSI